MSDQFIGEIRWFPYARGVPVDWQTCDGSLLQIADYSALYALIGTQYGGDGQVTFAVPDLRGRLPIHQGTGPGLSPRSIGQAVGTEGVTLSASQLGGHTHLLVASGSAATTTNPAGALPAGVAVGDTLYISSIDGATAAPLAAASVQSAGNTLAHENRAPTLTLRAAIATLGVYPPPPS